MSSINSISGLGSSFSSNKKLSDTTKRKLEAMGIDTSQIQTEAQGLAKLAQSSKGESVEETKGSKPPAFSMELDSQKQMLKTEIEQLAAKVGASVSSSDNISIMLSKISESIEVMKTDATQDSKKVTQYEAEYIRLVALAGEAKSSGQSALMNSLSAMASYNKIGLNLQS